MNEITTTTTRTIPVWGGGSLNWAVLAEGQVVGLFYSKDAAQRFANKAGNWSPDRYAVIQVNG